MFVCFWQCKRGGAEYARRWGAEIAGGQGWAPGQPGNPLRVSITGEPQAAADLDPVSSHTHTLHEETDWEEMA